MAKLTVEIPDSLLSQLSETGQPLEEVVLKALQQYIQVTPVVPITQTQTWQLCGALEISAPEAQYVLGQDESGRSITNYAEHIDDVLY